MKTVNVKEKLTNKMRKGAKECREYISVCVKRGRNNQVTMVDTCWGYWGNGE